jgi:hypothetical protein
MIIAQIQGTPSINGKLMQIQDQIFSLGITL